ncbi:MAG: hypothetical protein AB7L92_07545 [Alphaproteobacteria bacterium]
MMLRSTEVQRPTRVVRGRGRPRATRPQHDHGTQELQEKRRRGETSEILDLCFARGLITQKQHWCGIHLRWLYTLRYGTPSVQATRLADVTADAKHCDPEWQVARDDEYRNALHLLNQYGNAQIVLDVCIFNESPGFLRPTAHMASHTHIEDEFACFTAALNILVKHWCEKPAKP